MTACRGRQLPLKSSWQHITAKNTITFESDNAFALAA